MIGQSATEIRKLWENESVHGPEVLSSDIALLEQRVGGLCDAYKEFLLAAGTQLDNTDDGFLFWRIDDVRFANNVRSEYGLPTHEFLDGAIVVADYLQESWWYVLWTTGPNTSLVSLVTGTKDETRKPIGNFCEFLKCYPGRCQIALPSRSVKL